MQFNPDDNSISIIADIDFLLFGNGDTFNSEYSLDDRTRNVNIAYDEAVAEIFKADPQYKWDDTTNSDFPIATTNLTANLDHYTMPDSTLVVNRVRIKDENGEFITLDPAERRELTDDDLNDTGEPEKYFKLGGTIFPVPVPDYSATSGVELEFQRKGNHFETTDTDTSPGFNSQYHQFLSVGAALRYAMANGMSEKVNMLTSLKEQIRKDIINYYEKRSPDQRPKLELKKGNVKRFGY